MTADHARLLTARLAALERRLRELDGPPALIVGDEADHAQLNALYEQEAQARERMLQDAAAYRRALARIAEGTYGACADCGDTIPAKRLAVVPTATRCVRCEEKAERARADAPRESGYRRPRAADDLEDA